MHTENPSFCLHAQTSRDDTSWQRDEGKNSARNHVPARTDHPGQAIRHRQVERAYKVCSTTRLAPALSLSCPVAFFNLSLSLELVNFVFLVWIEVFDSHLPLACTQNNHITRVPCRDPWSCLADCIGFYTIHEGHIDTSSTAAIRPGTSHAKGVKNQSHSVDGEWRAKSSQIIRFSSLLKGALEYVVSERQARSDRLTANMASRRT